MAELVSLTLGHTAWAGWKTATVTRSIETLAGSFSLVLADRWEASGTALAVSPDMGCTLSLGGETVITGFIDEVNPAIDSRSHSISVTGRDASADLVDCSAVHEPGEWLNVSLADVAARLAAPFGVPVRASILSPERFAKFAVQPGETAFSALERACRLRGVLAWADGQGGIIISEPGTERASEALVEGKNVKAASARFSRKGRYSRYIVKAQAQGSDSLNGVDASQVRGEAVDASLTRYRPLLITSEGSSSTLTARGRARWEATVRAGRAAQVTVTVAGWRTGNGELWPVGSLVAVSLPSLHVERDMLISCVRFSLDSGGSKTRLTLVRPDAFAPQTAFRAAVPTLSAADDPTPTPMSYAEEFGR